MALFDDTDTLRTERMWKMGWKVPDIAYALGRNTNEVQDFISKNRTRFPRRRMVNQMAHAPILRAPPKRANAYHHRCDNGAIVNLPVIAGYTPPGELTCPSA